MSKKHMLCFCMYGFGFVSMGLIQKIQMNARNDVLNYAMGLFFITLVCTIVIYIDNIGD